MKSHPRELVPLPRLPRCGSGPCAWLAVSFVALVLPCSSPAGQAPPPARAHQATSAGTELATRIAAANTSRESADPAAIAVANGRLIATALRDLAALRTFEGAYPQAIALYQDSLTFESSPEARVGLAMAESHAGHYDEAIRLAKDIGTSSPGDLRAYRILSSALVQQGKFQEAVEPLQRIAATEPSVENQYAIANCLLQTRTPENRLRAEQVFKDMEKRSGDSGSLHVLFGRAYRDAEDMPAAIREFQRAIAIDPRTPHAHYFLGLAQLSLNEWRPTPEANAEMKKEAAFYPHDYLANYMVGFLASGERRYSEAEPSLMAASEINPSAPEPFLYMGLDAYAQGDMKRSEEMLRKAVELSAGDESRSNYQIRRAYVDLGRILANSGRKDESEVFLTKARELQNKTMEQSQRSIANITLAGGARSAAAVVPLSAPPDESSLLPASGASDPTLLPANSKLSPAQRAQAAEEDKLLRATLGLAFNDLATSEAVRGQFPQALGHYQQARQWDSSLPGLNKNLGQSAFRAGNFTEAINALTDALREQPASSGLRAMLGIAFFNTDQYAQAVETFTPLGEPGMHDDETGYAWAASLARTGDMKKATEVLLAYSSQPRPDVVALLIGQLWTAIGDYPRAISTLEQALGSQPSLRKAHLYEGLAYIHWEHWPEAAREFEAELALSPGDPDAAYHLGYVCMQQGKLDDAVAHFRQVIATEPRYANAQYQMGKILLDRGDVPAAIGYLEAAARLSPETDYIHYQLQAAYRKANRPGDADRELDIYKHLKAQSRGRSADAASIAH